MFENDVKNCQNNNSRLTLLQYQSETVGGVGPFRFWSLSCRCRLLLHDLGGGGGGGGENGGKRRRGKGTSQSRPTDPATPLSEKAAICGAVGTTWDYRVTKESKNF